MSGERPGVDVVVPFAGTPEELDALGARLAALRTRPDDTLTIADNRGRGRPPALTAGVGVRVVDAAVRRGSYHARNVGAHAGDAPWVAFLDGDVEPAHDLLDRLFEPPPDDRTGVLAGAVVDQPPPRGERGSPALRYAWLRSAMSQEAMLGRGRWAFAQTACCAVRREAFEEVGGFRGDVRSGGDADLCFRLAGAGWRLESRPGAAVMHRNRTSLPAMLRQLARHGSGAAWLAAEHPGAFPARGRPGLAWWAARRAAHGLAALARGDRDEALVGLLDGPATWAFELGRALPNRPRSAAWHRDVLSRGRDRAGRTARARPAR